MKNNQVFFNSFFHLLILLLHFVPLLYIFLKVLLDETQTANDGQVIAEKLMTQLGVKEEDLISGAYMDMIIKQKG